MIAQLRGTLVECSDNTVILDVGGVGYAVTVSGKTRAQLSLSDKAVVLLTEMIIREDSMTLFGFLEPAERYSFRLLITVQGVGAKAALAILSVLSPAELSSAITAGDRAMVSLADGVGPKLAQRVVNELSEKIGKLRTLAAGMAGVDLVGTGSVKGDDVAAADAMSALLNLGYGRAEAHAALLRARQKMADTGASEDVSSLIASALQEMGS